MAFFYADSSVLVKRHLVEPGTLWMQALADPAARNRILTAHITHVEGMSALNRRRREGTLDIAQYASIADDLVALCATEYQVVALSPAIVDRCRQLLEAYPLRAYDAVQLATAVLSNQALIAGGHPPLTFLAADRRLRDSTVVFW
ncbi:MAG TPA: type II toxin-antitoxin system VapC family toxin [Herpetosiphonaceae bacterium]|nr:type II toxin-antitoxin system VapC family toxin [Herpetosiphonaceae bacterium]